MVALGLLVELLKLAGLEDGRVQQHSWLLYTVLFTLWTVYNSKV